MMPSMKSIIKSKTFWNDNETSYIDIELSETHGTGGANDVKGYHFAVVELIRRNTKGLRKSVSVIFLEEDYSDNARNYFDNITSLKEGIKIIKDKGDDV